MVDCAITITCRFIRLNRMGLELVTAIDGHHTVSSLLDRFGKWVCGPDGETGQWHLERWSLPNYSLCYFGTDAPSGDRHGAKWDLLLQQIREGWSGKEGFEGGDHLTEFHLKDITKREGHFDTIETTVSHLFASRAKPCKDSPMAASWPGISADGMVESEAAHRAGSGRRPGVRCARTRGRTDPSERNGVRYLFLDITKPFLESQLTLGSEGGWETHGVQANGEWLPIRDASIDLVIDNENLADMTPVQLTRKEVESGAGVSALNQEAIDWIRRIRLPLDQDMPAEFLFNLGPLRFVSELWRVLRPGGHAVLIEFGIEAGWPAPVKLPGHTEYEVQYSHLRHAVKWLGFHEQYFALPQFMVLKPDTVYCARVQRIRIQRFCQTVGKPFAIRAYTEGELKTTYGDMLPRLMGCHYHELIDPAWFGLWDFKVLSGKTGRYSQTGL